MSVAAILALIAAATSIITGAVAAVTAIGKLVAAINTDTPEIQTAIGNLTKQITALHTTAQTVAKSTSAPTGPIPGSPDVLF